jgi:hypothetical protein
MKYKINKKFVKYAKGFASYQKLAVHLGVSKATAYFWAHGKAIPNHNNMQMLVKKTKGQVNTESWYV